jgi:signal transduction histidine kinase
VFGTRHSLRRRVSVLMVVAGLVVAVMALGVLVSISNLSTARQRLVDRYDPALVASADLLAAAVNQETGVRGFVLSNESSFLDPWISGQQSEAILVVELDDLLRGDERAVDALADFEDASAEWRARAGTPLSTSTVDQPTEELLALSKTLFDDVRTQHGALDQIVAQNRVEARADLNLAADWLRGWSIAMIAMLVLLLIGIAVELRRAVLGPLTSTVDQVGVVAGGDLDHRIDVRGPSEFVELGAATDAMRRQIVGQLRAVDESRAELALSNRELEQFAYVASHDLQEPLRKVTAFCRMLQERYGGQLDERADTYIDFAVDGATRMQALINDLLTLSRVGRTQISTAEVPLDDVVARAVANVSESIEEAGAAVTVGAMPIVEGERSLLIALFQNLVSNAVKFRDPSRRPVISITSSGGAGERFQFDVADNGIGIEPQHQERVFVVFQRLHTREEYAGTGIGLAICRKIVEHHGGRMWIADDHTGPGTTFRFTLPEPIEQQPDEFEDPGVAQHVE